VGREKKIRPAIYPIAGFFYFLKATERLCVKKLDSRPEKSEGFQRAFAGMT